MKTRLATMGVLDKHILEYLRRMLPKETHDKFVNFLTQHSIKESSIIKATINENDEWVVYTLQIKGYQEDLYIKVKKEGGK